MSSVAILDRLVAAGMSEAAAQQSAALLERAGGGIEQDGSREVHHWFVPGRVEFLGKHTDYCGGRSLICAVERGFHVTASPRRDRLVRITDVVSCERVEFPLDAGLTPTVGHWSNYPMTVARRIANNFGRNRGAFVGADIAFASSLPAAAGLSSSSAMIVATFLVLSKFNDLPATDAYRDNIHSTEDLASYLGTVENGQSFGTLIGGRGVGTFGGSQDHTAILCSRPGALVQYSFCPARFERSVPLPADHVLLIGASGVIAEKTGAALIKFNRISQLPREIVRLWNAATMREDATLADVLRAAGGVEPIRQVLLRASHDMFTLEELVERLEQFTIEREQIIPQVADALAAGDFVRVGTLVDRSQHNSERMLHNQVEETIYLAWSARELGAVAASTFGAGFGGSVWALVPRDRLEPFTSTWTAIYGQRFTERADRFATFVTGAGPAAMEL